MKRLIRFLTVLILTVLISNISKSQTIAYKGKVNNGKNDLEEMNLNDSVKSITIIGYIIQESSGKVEEKRRMYKGIIKFNEKGDKIAERTIRPNGKFNIKASYNSEAKLIEYIRYGNKDIYDYDSKGNVVKRRRYDEKDNFKFYVTYQYDSFGNLIFTKFYNPNGKLYNEIAYKYDENGRIIEYKSRGSMYQTYEYYYTEGGKVKKIDKKLKNSSSVTKFKYGDNGNLIEENEYHSDGTIKKMNKYNDNGYLKKILKYNEDGSLGRKISYKRTYDSHNNWIRTIINRNEYSSLIEREIEYYK